MRRRSTRAAARRYINRRSSQRPRQLILLPGALIGIFSRSVEVLAIERIAFPTIGASFPSAAFSLIGLNYTWLAFPVAETAAGALGYIMYRRQLKVWK